MAFILSGRTGTVAGGGADIGIGADKSAGAGVAAGTGGNAPLVIPFGSIVGSVRVV